MKFPRAIRLDGSDLEVYEAAAEPGEWAIPGSFAFINDTPHSLAGKRLQAFRSGFLGTSSFGWCTLVEVAEIDEDQYQEVIDRLAQHFVRAHGAPHIAAALPVAADEADYAAGICHHPLHTLLGIERDFGDDGIVESLKVLRPRDASDHGKVRLWGPQ
jgi:hypothetical protein